MSDEFGGIIGADYVGCLLDRREHLEARGLHDADFELSQHNIGGLRGGNVANGSGRGGFTGVAWMQTIHCEYVYEG